MRHDVRVGSVQQMSGESLRIVFKIDTLPSALALNTIEDVLTKNAIPLTGYSLQGVSTSFEAIKKTIASRPGSGFTVSGQACEFRYGALRQNWIDYLTIGCDAKVGWDDWASAFAELEGFVMAWVYDRDYDRWQNMKDPGEYKAAGKDCSRLPQKSNGLPYPFEQQEIDISKNPGRYEFRKGYIEAVGAPMWFGELFWLLAAADKTKLAAYIRSSTPKAVKIAVADHCFRSADGAEGALQLKLRSLLYPPKQG